MNYIDQLRAEASNSTADPTDSNTGYSRLPSYMVAADNHQVANGDLSLSETIKGIIGGAGGAYAGALVGQAAIPVPILGGAIGAAVGAYVGGKTVASDGKYAATALLSGANSFYNSGIEIGNMLSSGEDSKIRDTQDWITSMDEDLGSYYRDNKESADLGGFISTSIIPGTLGIKAYNMGSKVLMAAKGGKYAANMEGATGLLGPMQDFYLKAAKTEIQSTQATYKMINANTLKALAAGAGEQALQGAVFETAVAATMFKSPILDDMDAGDLGSNILFGAMTGGIFGGVMEGAIGYKALTGAKKAMLAETTGTRFIKEYMPNTSADEKIILYKDDLFNSPKEQLPELISKYGEVAKRQFEDKITAINGEVRLLFRGMSSDDVVGNMLADINAVHGTTQELAGKVFGLKNASRISEYTPDEIQLNQLKNKINSGKQIDSAEYDKLDATKVSYMQTYGPNAGAEMDSVLIPALTDKLRSGESIKILEGKGVQPGKANFIAVSHTKPFDMLTATSDQIEARYLYTIHSKPLAKGATVNADDLPFLEKVYNDFTPELGYKVKLHDGSIITPASKEELSNLFIGQKTYWHRKYQDASINGEIISDNLDTKILNTNESVAKQLSLEEIAKRTNTKLSFLEGDVNTLNPDSDFMAMQSYASEYATRYGIKPEEANNVLLQPQHIKLARDTSKLAQLNGDVLDAIASIKQRQVVLKSAVDNVFASVMGESHKDFFSLPEDAITKANPFEANAGLISTVNGDLGTLGSFTQKIGMLTNREIKTRINYVTDSIQPILNKLKQDQSAVLEASTTFNKLRATPENYVINDEGTGLILRGVKGVNDKRKAAFESGDSKKAESIKDYVKTDDKAPDEIAINNPLVMDLIKAHVSHNGERVSKLGSLRNIQGHMDMKDPNTVYTPPVNTSDFRHFAFAVDETITGTGHVSMIYAASESELEQLRHVAEQVKGIKTYTKADGETYHKYYGDYQADLGLNENQINTALHRKGVSASFFPTTDGEKFTSELMQWHIMKEKQLVREAVSTKYIKEFAELSRLGKQFTSLAESTFGSKSLVRDLDKMIKNPYMNYIKLALDQQQSANVPMWTTFANWADNRVSGIYNDIVGTLAKTKSPEELDLVNKMMQDAGIKTAYYDAATDALVNHAAPKNVLNTFIGRANALLAHSVLGDVFNTVNNVVGSVILTAPEMVKTISAIKAVNPELVGELAYIKIPGSENSVFSAAKIMTKAVANFSDKALVETAVRDGAIHRQAVELHAITDELTLKGAESVQELNGKITNAYNKTMKFMSGLRTATGNKLAEEFTRFVAWDSMRQVTNIAIEQGVMDAATAKAYMQTFVNRTQGNYLASQRPLMFSGPVGQAIGLFQTYQFNMAQQLLRHVADGDKKTAAMILGLQGTIYGMNGLPAFQAMNMHLIGNAAGNKEHKDVFSVAFGTMNKDAAEWVMYGAASNMLGLFHPDLKFNLYSRGDINPRNATIVPTSFEDIPIVSATSKIFNSVVETAGKLMEGGAPATTILQGIEHSGVNRSLMGIAQAAEAFANPNWQGFSTTNAGNISAMVDLYSVATWGRFAGARPLDEAIAIDAGFRYNTYHAKDLDRIKALGETVKTKVIGNQQIDPADIENLAKEYVKSGGRQQNFNKFMTDIYKRANTSQANVIADNLKSPYSKQMQELMGGRMRDFSNSEQ